MSRCTVVSCRPAVGCCCSPDRQTAIPGSSRSLIATTSGAIRAHRSALASGATSVSAHRWPGSKRASRSVSWHKPSATTTLIQTGSSGSIRSTSVAWPPCPPPSRSADGPGDPTVGTRDAGGSAMTTTVTLPEPPQVSGGLGPSGHLEELRSDPISLMQRVRAECGAVGEFRLAERPVVLLSGSEANEVFFRAEEDELDQAEAYPFMTPIFGEGVVFDAPPERRREMLHNQALRDRFMRGHAETIAAQVAGMVGKWGAAGSVDLLDWFAELTIYTSSACLIGHKFRDQLDERFARLYHDLEQGTDAIAFVDPYAPIDSFRRRDEARAGLVDLVQEIMDRRRDSGDADAEKDLLDVLMSVTDADGRPRFSTDEVTGMFISMMFAG